ncbi:MAG: hypothetical protein QGI33_04300 [Candidatus Brocadiia bacterium]|jgi:hypothetical protein|nr:hypothetical protein [Candidatus Brocadiia bacterium]
MVIARISELGSAGEDLSYTCTAARNRSLLRGAKHHYGSGKGAIEAVGIDYERDVRRLPKWTRERIVEAIKEALRQGADLSWAGVVRHPSYVALAYAAIRRSVFGSWDAALRTADAAPGEVRRYEAWDNEKVLAGIRTRAHHSALYSAACKHFGSWTIAPSACGIRKGVRRPKQG